MGTSCIWCTTRSLLPANAGWCQPAQICDTYAWHLPWLPIRFQGSQDPYYDLCGELFLFLSPHQCFLFITKTRVWWIPACILLRDEKKILGKAKKTQDFYGTEFYNRSGWAWVFPVLVCTTKLFYWNKYVPTNSQMEHKAVCQQLILFEQTGLKEQEKKNLPPGNTFVKSLILWNDLMLW